MAVYAAHLTRTLQGTPTVFQVTAQEALGSTVKPALKKFVEYLAATYPTKCSWSLRWYDELYLLFDCFLQYHYLKHYAASFSESFYGLLRVPINFSSEFSSGPRLPVFLERASLALLVLVPYVSDKVDRIVEQWRNDHEDGKLGKNSTDRLRRAAIRVYSIIHLVSEGWRLVQLARYMMGSAKSHSPWLAAMGLSLAEAPPQQLPEDQYTWSDFLKSLITGQFGSAAVMAVTYPMWCAAALGAVEYGAFAVQFLRWWESSHATHDASLPTPAPPPKDSRALRWKNKCPLCLQTWKIPTVLPVSGYIFCYMCISRHVRANSNCPITRYPAVETSLVRLYID